MEWGRSGEGGGREGRRRDGRRRAGGQHTPTLPLQSCGTELSSASVQLAPDGAAVPAPPHPSTGVHWRLPVLQLQVLHSLPPVSRPDHPWATDSPPDSVQPAVHSLKAMQLFSSSLHRGAAAGQAHPSTHCSVHIGAGSSHVLVHALAQVSKTLPVVATQTSYRGIEGESARE